MAIQPRLRDNPRPCQQMTSHRSRIPRPLGARLQSGGWLPFLLEVAAGNHKTQGKQAKDQRVFFRLWDDLVVDYRPHVPKTGMCARPVESSRMKVADGFVEDAVANPKPKMLRWNKIKHFQKHESPCHLGCRNPHLAKDGKWFGCRWRGSACWWRCWQKEIPRPKLPPFWFSPTRCHRYWNWKTRERVESWYRWAC